MTEEVDWSLRGKVAIVTGAAVGGVGEAYARRLAHAGAHVVCADIRAESAAAVADEIIAEGGQATAMALDVSDESSVATFVDQVVAALGGVDVLVNNAALMATITGHPSTEMSKAEWDTAFAVNVTGVWMLSKAVAPSMASRGGGRIINISSIGAYPPTTVYGITKLGVIGVTVMMAKELGRDNITVNAIAPGNVLSDAGKFLNERGPAYKALMDASAALPRASAEPDELSGLLLLLASPAGAFITAQVIRIDAGVVLRP